VKILDDDGKPVRDGETGRIFVGNSLLFEGYTGGGHKEVVDGLMSSGDVGRIGDDGRLYIEGRDDEMIVSGGENVFPKEVEDCLARHDGVVEVAAIGVEDDEFGKRLRAFVVRAQGSGVTEEDLRDHVKAQGAFALRIGPAVPVRRWHADTVKAAIADDAVGSLRDVTPDVTEDAGMRVRALLERLGFDHLASDDGFAAGQPEYVFQLPLAGRTEEDVLAGMNQLWRRNIKKSAKQGVVVTRGEASDLPAFHAAYLETATRDHFTPRPLSYFERMFQVMEAENDDRIRLYLAHHDEDLVAATTWVRVGTHTWYSYGASTAAKREVQGSTAIQWQMMRDAIAAGADVYDLRGITDTVAADDSHAGLIRFKVGTGGEAVEYVGEWDLPLNKLLYKGFDAYMRRRG